MMLSMILVVFHLLIKSIENGNKRKITARKKEHVHRIIQNGVEESPEPSFIPSERIQNFSLHC